MSSDIHDASALLVNWSGHDVGGRSIREDRILAEALASRGDARRLHDLFGLSINASLRYTNVVDHPGFSNTEPPGRPHTTPTRPR